MEELRYWVWLSQCFAYGSPLPEKLLKVCPSPKRLYEMKEEERTSLQLLRPRDLKALSNTPLSLADRILQKCAHHKIRVLSMADPDYPRHLYNIYAPPVVLYALGNIAGLNDEAVITVVGTRMADRYALEATSYLASGIARAGGVIASGCAVGIDSAAHLAAVEARKRTIAVLACGIDINYPAESAKLKRRILNTGGVLLTEYPPGVGVFKGTFPVRNRILAGIASGVLVTQAPVRSGALLTANHAIDQGKELFCLPPYSIFDPKYAGVIQYLREGAIPVFSPEDVLLPYYAAYPDKIDLTVLKGTSTKGKIVNGPTEQAAVPAPSVKMTAVPPEMPQKKEPDYGKMQKNPETLFDELHRLVYNQLNTHPMSVDELAIACKLDAGTLFSVLTDLEIEGVVSPLGGGRYQKEKDMIS